MTRPQPARRHLDPAGRWRLAPGLVGAGALIVALAGVGGLLHTWASGWDTARASVSVPTVERSRFVAEEVPPLDVTVTSRSERSEVVATVAESPSDAPEPFQGVQEVPEQVPVAPRATPAAATTTPAPTTTPAVTTTVPTTPPTTSQPPSTTTAAPTTTSATSTTTPATTPEETPVPTPTTEFAPPGLEDDEP